MCVCTYSVSVCRSRACGCACVRMCVRACAVSFHGIGRCCAAGSGRTRMPCARQVHRLHEGEGASRVARPVQALGVPVRPAPAAAVRVRGGGGAALLPRALPHLALGHTARPSPAHAWLARAARPARGTGWGRSRPAAAARSARREASNSELAALPAVVDWPKLKLL